MNFTVFTKRLKLWSMNHLSLVEFIHAGGIQTQLDYLGMLVRFGLMRLHVFQQSDFGWTNNNSSFLVLDVFACRFHLETSFSHTR